MAQPATSKSKEVALLVKRILLVLSVAALMAAMMVVSAMPAFAAKGGIPNPNSEQGKGKVFAPGQLEKQDPDFPDSNCDTVHQLP